uniref:Retrotransposon protein, putative, unclassified n=1 Tax=Tanacetum cinerariifolium TaxID=118510 RepID=A0A699HBI5_TANCI|nr:retrotransposon protein, putative, unclassified [Tanacetum cinerariifolium]
MERRNQALVEAARTMLTFANLPMFLWAEAIATAYFTQNHSIIHKIFDKTPYELMNKRKPNIKLFRVFGCRCYLFGNYEDVGKLKAKGDIKVFVGYSKESAAFRIYNKQTRKIHESVNVNFDEISEMASKQFSLEPEDSSSPSLNDDVQQSSKEVVVPSLNTQSISNNMIPNVDEASTSHNVFNECLEDAYFDASTSFHDPSNVHTFYQPYPHEKKWTKDHPLHKIIGDPKLNVRTRVPTPMVEQAKLKLDLVGKPADHTDYRSMIGPLMYFTSSRPDIMFVTSESKYVAVSSCCTQVLWMRAQLTDYGFFYDKVPIYCDSKSAIAISCNPVQHTRTKHIDVRYHFIKDHVEKGTIELYFVGTEYQLADLFMKSLLEARFKFLVEKLGMMSRET